MRELGLDAFRFSIAWPRVVPGGRGRRERRRARLLRPPRRRAARSRASGRSRRSTTGTCRRRSRTPAAGRRATPRPRSPSTSRSSRRGSATASTTGRRTTSPSARPGSATATGVMRPAGTHRDGLAAAHHVLLSHGLALEVAPADLPTARGRDRARLVADTSGERRRARRRGRGEPTASATGSSSTPCCAAPTPRRCSSASARRRAVGDGDLEADRGARSTSSASTTTRARSSAPTPRRRRRVEVPARRAAHRRSAGRSTPTALYEVLVRLHREYGVASLYVTENGAAFADVRGHDGAVHDPERDSLPRAATSTPRYARRRRAFRVRRLLRLVAARQLRVGGRLLEAVRDRLRRLPDARTGPEVELPLVPRPDRVGARRRARGCRLGPLVVPATPCFRGRRREILFGRRQPVSRLRFSGFAGESSGGGKTLCSTTSGSAGAGRVVRTGACSRRSPSLPGLSSRRLRPGLPRGRRS